jgi:hypothetical protein
MPGGATAVTDTTSSAAATTNTQRMACERGERKGEGRRAITEKRESPPQWQPTTIGERLCRTQG